MARNVALVTGGGRGIGLGISRCLVKEGFDLAICGRGDQSRVADALEELRRGGADVLYCQADISDDGDRRRLIDQVRSRFGKLNVLVNNAGVAPQQRADILDATVDSYRRVMAINLEGPYFLTQLAANWMIQQKQADPAFNACIITVSSTSATVASPSRGEYCLSKAALSMASQLYAARLGPLGIGVYEVRPGIILTDMTAPVKAKYDALIAQGLLIQPRWGTPADVGQAVALLARGELPYSPGQVITVDGGLTLPRL
jgi:NAD(P)-dependent dehydrogenase (short-subunit alcohol dehydrogenase family)